MFLALPFVDHLYQADLDQCESLQSYIENELQTTGRF